MFHLTFKDAPTFFIQLKQINICNKINITNASKAMNLQIIFNLYVNSADCITLYC